MAWLLFALSLGQLAEGTRNGPSLHANSFLQMLQPAMTHDEDHRAPFQRRPDTLSPSSELEVAETDELTGLTSDALYDDEICDMCMWAVEHIVSKCCVSGSALHKISCDPHLPSCENNVTYSLMRKIAHAQAKKTGSCWTSSFTCSNPKHEMFDRVWSDLTGLGNILRLWQKVRPLKPTSALAAFEVCKMGVSETYDCVGDVDSGHIRRGKTELRDLPNSDVKTQDHRKHTCKSIGLSEEDHWQGCSYEDKRCLKTAKTWKTMRMCAYASQKPKGEKIDLTLISDDELDSFDEDEDEDAEPDPFQDIPSVQSEQEEVVFQADEDLGFPELEIRWNPELNSWTAADGKFDKTNQECLRKLGEESNLTQFLGDGTSQKLVKDMCIFLYEIGDEPGAAGTWYLENVPTEVRGLLKTAYGGGSFTGFLFRTLLTVEDNLQNVGFGSGLVKKANKVTSKYDQKGVKAYETKDLEKKLHYIRHFVETYKVDLESVEGLQGCGNEDACVAKAGEIFPTYNHFFYRKLALGSRKMLCYSQDAGECQEIDENARATKSLVSPADGRVIVFPDFIPEKTGFWVKGEQFLLQSLVSFERDSDYRYYDHGVAFIVRLAPQDYHRFHFPVDGVVKSFENYPGNYYSVNPIAVQSTDPVFTTNKRMHVTLDTGEDNLGCVTYVSVGATNVGSVMHTSYVGQEVLRGMEHGYMAFGGSTVLVFVRRGVLDVVDPIRQMSSIPVETIVHLGDLLATQKTSDHEPLSGLSSSPCS